MKKLLILFLLFSEAKAQYVSLRASKAGYSLQMSAPAISGQIQMTISKEDNRKLTYLHYLDETKLGKHISIFGGAGIHLGARLDMRYEKDAQTIFLAGATAVGGLRYYLGKFVISTDLMPRVDFPIFDGCEMHRYCSEATLGSINFGLSYKL